MRVCELMPFHSQHRPLIPLYIAAQLDTEVALCAFRIVNSPAPISVQLSDFRFLQGTK